MSDRLVRSVLDSHLVRGMDKLVLAYLARCCNTTRDDHSCWPKKATIAETLGISEKTVSRCLKDLRSAGLVDTITKGTFYRHVVRGDKLGPPIRDSHSRGPDLTPLRGDNLGVPRGDNLTPHQDEKRTEKRTKNHHPPREVEGIYRLYPRKKGKGAALKAIEKALRNGQTVQSLTEAVQRYAQEVQDKDPQYIPYPATWFNQQRYLDEPEAKGPCRTCNDTGHYFDDRLREDAFCKCPIGRKKFRNAHY